MVEHDSAEEEAMHIMHDSPSGESEMEAQIESVVDVRLTLGSTIEEEQTNARASSMVTVVSDTHPQDMLEVDGIVLWEASRQQEYDISDHEREELLEMVEHPSLGRPTDEVQ